MNEMMTQTHMQIDLEAIRQNVAAIKKKLGPKVKIMPVVKDNAYGHGAVEVSRCLEKCDIECFVVATLEEGIELREAGIKAPILIQCPTLLQKLGQVIEYELIQTISSAQMLKAVENEARTRDMKAQVHVKYNTGLNRTGVMPSELGAVLDVLSGCDYTSMTGFFTHFAASEAVDKSFTYSQIHVFDEGVKRVKEAGYSPMIHASNSGGLHDLPQAHYDAVRVGISLFGYYPSQHVKRDIPLRLAMSWRTQVVHTKEIAAGESVSYNYMFTAWRQTKVATIRVGYGDGYRRSMAGKAQVLLNGRRAPVIGTICMDMCMVDVTDLPDVKVGDEVILLGGEGRERIDADEMAAWCGTISYELFTGISPRVERVYV